MYKINDGQKVPSKNKPTSKAYKQALNYSEYYQGLKQAKSKNKMKLSGPRQTSAERLNNIPMHYSNNIYHVIKETSPIRNSPVKGNQNGLNSSKILKSKINQFQKMHLPPEPTYL